MTEILCGYPDRDQAIVTYLYDDLDEGARAGFDAHLVLCAACRAEVAQLRAVRRELGLWEVVSRRPSVARPAASAIGQQSSAAGAEPAIARRASWRDIPAWAQVAAAVLCVGIAAGFARLDIRYDQQGLSVRTGWLTTESAPANAAPPAAASAGASAPWGADLAALERSLRTEFESARPATGALPAANAATASDAALMRRVRALVEESERRQERELALRVGQVIRDVNAQRQADLRKIDSNLGFIQSNTGAEVMKQRQLLMNYLVRVSSQK